MTDNARLAISELIALSTGKKIIWAGSGTRF